MKELSIEQKGKAYDGNYKAYTELINRLEDVKKAIKKQNYGIAIDILCKPYPEFQVTTHSELKDEDERIRNFLIKQANSVLDSITDDEEVPAWKSALAWLEKQGNLMKALQISNAKIGELIEKNYYLREQLEKQGNNMGISEATKQKLEDNLNKALEKETPESWNKFLDEQGEQKHIIEMITPEESLGIDSETYNKIVDECIYGEQKPDKVEPKFKVGDWLQYRNAKPFFVEEITKQGYVNGDSCLPFNWENEIHLWTIQDAKDGDVLCYKDEILLYKHDIKNCTKQETIFGGFVYHCCYDGEKFIVNSLYSITEQDKMDIHPATKEQHNQLEKAMADAGYEWDAKNKQLRKIESRQEELTEFEKAVKQVMEEAIECGDIHNLKADADMLLRLVQKSSWSEEDEEQLDRALYMMEQLNMTKSWDDVYNWLKSLKERYTWKPSDEQMQALSIAMCGVDDPLFPLYQDLKKLREE